MTPTDIVILVVLVASAGLGFHKGLIAQAGLIGGMVLGVVAARLLAPSMAAHMSAITSNPDPASLLNTALAYLLVFVAVFLLVKLVARLVKAITHVLCLGVIDRLAGALFTLFEWMLGLSIVLNLWLILKPDSTLSSSTLAGGRAIEFILALAPKVVGWATASPGAA